MSGHSKWSTIKRKKGAQDARRSRLFSRMAKEIQVAVKEGDADPEMNPRLRLAIANAKGVNMPKDNIERAISKAQKEPSNLEEVSFEGYAPHGIALFIECLTDNHNRTVSSIRSTFNKKGGSLGTNGSVAFMFETKGVLTVPVDDLDREDFELEIIDAGAEEIELEDDVFVITTSYEDFGNAQKKIDEMGLEAENAGLRRIPLETKTIPAQDALSVLRIIEEFEENEDIQNVYHNLEITDEVLEALDNE